MHYVVVATLLAAMPDDVAKVMPQPIRVPGTVRHDTAVLLFAPPTPEADADEPSEALPLWFAPLICTKKKRVVVGAACADLLPAQVKVQTTGGAQLTLERGGGHVGRLKPPFAPACCNYASCDGKTVPLRPRGGPWQSRRAVLAVWPADADLALEILPETPVAEKLFTMSLLTLVMASTDVNHDGKFERILFAPFANDYGLAVMVGDDPKPALSYSCGNI